MSRHYHSLLRRYLVCNLLFLFLAGCPVNERTERMQSETMDTELTCEMGYVEMGGECVPDVDRDEDRDGVPDTYDNCPAIGNAHQRDCDLDGIGDDCDEDYPCGATLVGEVTTVTDLNVGVINFSGGLIRLLPSGNVTEIDEIGFYRMPISVGEHTVQVFDPVDILRAQLDVGEAPDDGAESPENMDENQDNPPPENAASDSDANETNADDLTIPVGVEPVAEKDIEITLFDMNQQVTLNVLVGGIGRLVGVVCLSDRDASEAVHDGIAITLEALAGGELQTTYSAGSGFFESPPLLFGEYYVNINYEGYEPVYIMTTIDRLGVNFLDPSNDEVSMNASDRCDVTLRSFDSF